MKSRIGIVVLVLAVAAGVASALYLLRVKETIERTTKTVEVSAPDLFPPETLVFVAAHRMDESWSAVESWWKRFETTAAWYTAEKQWDRAREQESLPPPVREAVDSFEKALDDAEKRLGYRPNTREFFETYGKYTAFGLLPAMGEGRPRMLLVVKLPGDAAMAMLKEKLGGATKRHAPPDLHGYPVYEEEGGPAGRILYGVGGGYLFVADDDAALDGALGRLAALAGVEKPAEGAAPAPSLSADPVFRRGIPETWADVGIALYARKDQQFARWKETLKILDEFVSHAFVLAPGDPAVALAMVRIPGGSDYEVRASFAPGGNAARPWPERLPAGMCTAWMSAPPGTPASREALLADVEAFRKKAIWKEADALLRDSDGLKRLFEEALGPGSAPEEEVLRRLPKDGEFLAEIFRAASERLVLSPASSFAFGQKVFEDGGVRVESVVAARFDPLESMLLAAALDLATEKGGEIAPGGRNHFERKTDSGVLSWRFHLSGLIEDFMGKGPRGRGNPLADDQVREALYRTWEPGVVLSGGTVWLTFGEGMYGEVRALAEGKGKALAADPLFREAAAAVPEGAVSLVFNRPAESWRGAVGGMRGQMDSFMGMSEPPPEAKDVVTALATAFEEVVLWQRSVRATVAATYADPSRASESVVLVDAAEEPLHPRLGLDPAALAAPDLLPAGVFLLAEGRVDVRPAAEAFTAAFLRGLPGGRERWDEMRADLEIPPETIEARLEALLVDMKGEAGMALAAPPAEDAGRLKGTQDLLDRIPALVLFSGYAHPDAAFETAAGLFQELADSLQERVPFEARRKAFDRMQGPKPWGFEAVRTEMEGHPMAAFRVSWPERPRGPVLSAGMAVVRRGDLLFFTTSLPVAAALAGADSGAPETFGARMRAALPAGTLPAECSGLLVAREDGFADCFALYARPLAADLAGFSLRGGEGGPPPEERLKAHREGWRRVAELLEDMFRTGSWTVGATVREKDRFRTVTRRVQGK